MHWPSRPDIIRRQDPRGRRSVTHTILRFKVFAAVASVLGCLAAPAQAQTYPTQPIRIIVPTPAGGIADLVGRTLATKLSEAGKTAVVENRTGGAGVIAADSVAKAQPDGYTL